MADSTKTPLLPEDYSDPPKLEDHHIPSLDSAIEICIGGFGWDQFLQAAAVSFAWFFDAQQTFLSVFTDTAPKWHLETGGNVGAASSADICRLPRDAWAWDAPAQASTVSEFGLQCSGPLVAGLPASAFFLGCLVGGLALATLADSSLGRKKMLFLSCLAMGFSAFLTAFSAVDVWTYSALRFFGGFARSSVGTCALVLATELVGKRWRGEVGVFGFVFFTLGFLSLPAMAYANRGSSWRNLYIWSSIPTIIYCIIVHFFVRESPRWLFVQGRREEAIATLNINQISISFSSVQFEEQTWNVDLYSTIKMLIAKRWALRRLTAVAAIGFGIGMVYYGMPLALGALNFNLYLSVALNALSEFPSSLVTLFLVGKFDRKASLLFFTSLSGVCSVVSAVKLGQMLSWARYLQIASEVVSFFGACTAFDLLLIFAIELFPTCVRNSAVSVVRQALVLGGVFGPPLAAGAGVAAYAVFGVVIGCCGLFVICLPETRGRRICDTMDEEECKLQSSQAVSC